MFVKERYLKKDMLAKKSKMVGEILNAQNIKKYLRDYSLKLNGNDLLDKWYASTTRPNSNKITTEIDKIILQ